MPEIIDFITNSDVSDFSDLSNEKTESFESEIRKCNEKITTAASE